MRRFRLTAAVLLALALCGCATSPAPSGNTLANWVGNWRALDPTSPQCEGAQYLMISDNGAGVSVAPVEVLLPTAPETNPYSMRRGRLVGDPPEPIARYRNWYEMRGEQVIAHFGLHHRCTFERLESLF
jgi:hypothetical protein